MNVGLILMVLLSLLPVGLMRTWASVTHGMWYARSAEFLQTGLMEKLGWMLIFGDSIFACGAISLTWFIFGRKTGWCLESKAVQAEPAKDGAASPAR